MPSAFISRRRGSAPSELDLHEMTPAQRRTAGSFPSFLELPLSAIKKALTKGAATHARPADASRRPSTPNSQSQRPVRLGRSLDLLPSKPFRMSTPFLLDVDCGDNMLQPNRGHTHDHNLNNVSNASTSSGSDSQMSQSNHTSPRLPLPSPEAASSPQSQPLQHSPPINPAASPPASQLLSESRLSHPHPSSSSRAHPFTLHPSPESQAKPPPTSSSQPAAQPNPRPRPPSTRLAHPVLPPGSIRKIPAVRPDSIRLTPSIVIRAPTRTLPALPITAPAPSRRVRFSFIAVNLF